jgi:hypothetical protein
MYKSNARRIVALFGVMAVVMGVSAPVSADGPSLVRVQNLVAEADIGYLTLTWTDPGNPDADGFLVCGQQGTAALPAPPEWCGDYDHDIVHATSNMQWFSPAQTWTYSVFARNSSGETSPATSITVRGSVTRMSTVPSSDKVSTGIRLAGRLTDGLTGAPMPGQRVDVYATRLLLPGEHSPNGFGNVDVLMEQVTTSATGAFERTYPLRRGWDYQARFHGTGVRMGNLSALVPADGSSFIDLGSTDAAALRARKRAITLVAKVPVQRAGDRVVFERMIKGRKGRKSRWARIATRAVGSSRTAVIRQRIPRRATPVYRAVLVQVRRTQQPSVPLRIRHG